MPWTRETLTETIVPSAARTASGQIASNENWGPVDNARFQVEVTAASGTTPSLQVFIEMTTDAGVNWDPIDTFPAVTAAGRTVRTVTNLVGAKLRVRWVITGTTPSFTFNVSAVGET